MSSTKAKPGEHLEDRLIPELSSALRDHRLSPAVQIHLAKLVERKAAVELWAETAERSSVAMDPGIAAMIARTDLFWRALEQECGLLTSTQAAEEVGAKATRSWASDQRKAGKLLAIERLNKLLYPGFQFHQGAVRPLIKRLTEIAKPHQLTDRDIILWLGTRTTYMHGEDRPLDHLDEPDVVADAAARSWGVVW